MKNSDPKQSIGFLTYEVSRLLRRDFEKRMHSLNLTQAQWRALAYIAHTEGCNQTTLADILEIRPITLTRQLDKLQEAGLLERRPDPSDRRAVQLHLTQAAKPLIATLRSKGQETKDLAFQGMSEDERDLLIRLLQKVKANLLDTKE